MYKIDLTRESTVTNRIIVDAITAANLKDVGLWDKTIICTKSQQKDLEKSDRYVASSSEVYGVKVKFI